MPDENNNYMNLKLHTTSKMFYAFLMTLFSVWGWGQTTLYTTNFGSGTTLPQNWASSNTSNGWSPNTSNTSTGYTGASGNTNIQFNNTGTNGVTHTLTLSSISTVGYTDISVLWAGRGTSSFNKDVIFQWSTNGTTWNDVTYIYSKNANSWALVNNGNRIVLPQGAENVSNLRLRFSSSSVNSGNYKIDDFNVMGTVSAPTVVPTVTASNFSGTVGVNFSQNIQASDNPTSYNVANGSSLPNGLTLDSTSGVISGMPTLAGTFTTDVTATNSVGTSNAATITFTIGKGTQTLTGFSNTNKYLSSPAFTFPLNTDNANLAIVYSSSNTGVATVSGNTVTITGIGTANITAAQGGNNDWNSYNQQIVLTVSSDPYNGIGKFEKINSLSDLADGYYVMAYGSSQAMNNTYSNSVLGNTAITVVSNVITDPSPSIVWKVVTNGASKSIFNEATGKYLSYTGTSNTIQVVDNVTTSNQLWDISYVSSLFVIANSAVTGRSLQYNASSPRFACYTGTQQDLTLYKRIENTTWNGSAWSNGSPAASLDVIITGNYSTNSQPAFTSKSITIKNGGVLEINGTNTINAADVTVEDGGNLVIKDSGVLNQTGAFKVLKNSASVQNKYAFWSSPVANQNLFTAYANGSSSTAPLYVMSYDPATNLYPTVANDNANFTNNAGKGYSVKVPATNASLVFGGVSQVPNNGTINVALSNAGDGYNLIGNPYPSNISLADFYTANNSAIEPTLWFWDNTTGNVTTQTGNTSVNVGFATFNAQSGTWTEAPNTQSYGSAALNSLGSFAKISQGFIVKSINGTAATFTNAMRTSAAAVTTNKNVNALEGKYWIRLNTSYGNTFTQAITYNQGASDAYDGYDSRAMGMGSDAFYSLAGTEKLVIQGRAPFQINDVVPLGNKHFENGDFTISLSHKEGLFTNGQPIYLHDKQTGTYTNLQSGNYTFAANAGDFTNRFEIVYKLNVLSTNETEKGTFEVYRDGEDFIVRNQHNIQSVEVFDSAGRKIQQISANSKSVTVKIQAKGVYILKAVSEGKPFTQKIIK